MHDKSNVGFRSAHASICKNIFSLSHIAVLEIANAARCVHFVFVQQCTMGAVWDRKKGAGGTARRENSCGPPPHRPVAARRSTSLYGIALLRRPIASPHCINACCVAILCRDIASPYCVALLHQPSLHPAPLEPLLPALKQQGLVESKLVLAF